MSSPCPARLAGVESSVGESGSLVVEEELIKRVQELEAEEVEAML